MKHDTRRGKERYLPILVRRNPFDSQTIFKNVTIVSPALHRIYLKVTVGELVRIMKNKN